MAGFFGNVNTENFLQNYYSLSGKTKKGGIFKLIDNAKTGNFNSFIEIVELIKNKTNDFAYFPSFLILEDSRILLIVRLLLGLSQTEFAKKLNMSKMTIEELENGYRKIKWPVTAREYSKRLEKLLSTRTISLDNINLNNVWQRWINKIKIKGSKDVGWKTIRKMGVEDFKKYFLTIKKATKDFKNFDAKLFQKTPQIISMFRILLGLTQRDLERKLNLKGRLISNYESNNYKTLSLGRSKMFAKFFESEFKNKKLQDISLNFAIEKFIEVKDSMYNHSKAALIGIKALGLTEQEKTILKNLKSIGKNNFRIEKHCSIETKRGIINTDFAIYLEDKLTAVIEATSFLHIESKKFSYNLKNRIYLTDYRFLKVKESFPGIKTFFIIDVEDNPVLKHRIKKSIMNETLAIDNVFINEEKNRISQILTFNEVK